MNETKGSEHETLQELHGHVAAMCRLLEPNCSHPDTWRLSELIVALRSSLVTASKERDEAREDAESAHDQLEAMAGAVSTLTQERDRLREALGRVKSLADRVRPSMTGRFIAEEIDAALAPSPTETSATRPAEVEAKVPQAEAASGDSPTSGPASPTEGQQARPRAEAAQEFRELWAEMSQRLAKLERTREQLWPTEGQRSAIDVERLRTAASAVLGLCNLLRGKGLYSDEVERKFCALSDAAGLTVGKGNYRPAKPTPPPEKTPLLVALEKSTEILVAAAVKFSEECNCRVCVQVRENRALLSAAAPPEKTYTQEDVDLRKAAHAALDFLVHHFDEKYHDSECDGTASPEDCACYVKVIRDIDRTLSTPP